MLKQLLAPQLVVIYFLALSAIYVHFRGRERLRIARQLGDHSTFLAPYNVLMYAGSAVRTSRWSRLTVFLNWQNCGTIGRPSVTGR